MLEYVIAILLQPREIGDKFDTWPIHITLAPWFQISDPKEAVKMIQEIAKSQNAFDVNVSREALFGPNQEVKVSLIKNTEVLKSLHDTVISKLEAARAKFYSTQYIKDQFVPHITHQPRAKVQTGYKIGANRIYLIGALVVDHKIVGKKKVVGFGEFYVNQT